MSDLSTKVTCTIHVTMLGPSIKDDVCTKWGRESQAEGRQKQTRG